MEWGLTQGLAQNLGYDKRIEDLRYNEQLNRQAQAQKQALDMAKNKMFFDDIDFQNGSNDFDAAIIKQENAKLLEELGALTNQYPDWINNREAQAKMKMMKSNMKSNPAVLRSAAYIDANKALQEDLAEASKNPTGKDIDLLRQQAEMRDNYRKFGHPMGKEAFDKEGAVLWTYERPRDLVALEEALPKLGKSINRFNVKKGGNLGEYMTEMKPEDLDAMYNLARKNYGREIELAAKRDGITDPAMIDKYVKDAIASGFEAKYSIGDVNAMFDRQIKLRELAMKEDKGAPSPNYTPFDDLFDNRKPAGSVPIDVVLKTWGNTPKIVVVGNKGETANLTGSKMSYDGRYVTDSKGRRLLTGSVEVPIETARQVGIWDGDDDDGGVSPAYLGKAVRRQKETKDGKVKTYVKVDYQLPVDPNDGTARQLYNTHAQPAKLVEALQYNSNLGGGRPEQREQDGYTYTWNPETNQYE